MYATSLLGGSEGTGWKGECVYLGSAYANCYRVCDMHVLSNNLKEEQFGVQFRVQPVTLARRKPNVKDADSITVWLRA